jgi:hypothetical protein
MRVEQKRSKEDSYPNTVGQEETSFYKTLTDIATNSLKAWIIPSNIDPQAQTSQLQVFRKARSNRVIPLAGTTNYYKVIDLLRKMVVSLLELHKICSSVPCLASLHHRARWCRMNLLHRISLYLGRARL